MFQIKEPVCLPLCSSLSFDLYKNAEQATNSRKYVNRIGTSIRLLGCISFTILLFTLKLTNIPHSIVSLTWIVEQIAPLAEFTIYKDYAILLTPYLQVIVLCFILGIDRWLLLFFSRFTIWVSGWTVTSASAYCKNVDSCCCDIWYMFTSYSRH